MFYFRKNNSKTRVVISVVLVFLIFFVGFFSGVFYYTQQHLENNNGTVDITKVIDLYGKTRSDMVSFDQFWTVWNMVKKNFVNQPVNEVQLFYGALEGMVAALEDPYSLYLAPDPAAAFARDLSGEFEGIGAEIGIRDNQLTLIAPLPGSPAAQAGLKAGDKIFAIDGIDTRGLTVDEAVNRIRGPKGTIVKLTITHDGFEAIQEVSIIRDNITMPTVNWEMKEKNLVYLRVSFFNEDTRKEFDKAVKAILLKQPKGIVLDLRNNPGGFLQASVDVASEWVQEGVIVREVFHDKKTNDYQSTGSHRFLNIPTVVLVDGGTASGSEIVAGALQDYGLAKIIGTQTFGKGSVQNFEVLPDGSALKLTVAKWFTPKEQQIDEQGITPDIVIEEPKEDETTKSTEPDTRDEVLEKALELLR